MPFNAYITCTEATEDRALGSGTGAGTSIVVPIDTVEDNTDTGNFSLASDVITVADAGEYRIDYNCVTAMGSSNPQTLRTQVQIDPNTTTFAAAPFSTCHSTGQNTERRHLTGSIQLTLVASSKIRLEVRREVGTILTTVDHVYTHVTVTKIRD